MFRWVSENIMIPCLLHKRLDKYVNKIISALS